MIVNLYDTNNGMAAFMHDTEGRLKKSYVYSGNSYINFRDYNSMGQLTRVYTENNMATPLVNITYKYDANGNITKETNLLDNSYVTYEYDNINQLTEEKYYNSSATLIKQITYKYESQYGGLLGNRTERTITEGGTSTTITYRYDAANQMTVTSVGTYTFDANGNMTQGSRTYAYNAENQLTQIISGGSTIAQYGYNFLRSKKTAGSLTEYYYYDNGNLVYITDESNGLKYYFTRDDQGNLLNMIDWKASPHKTYWYVFDAHQSALGLVDNSGQFVVTYQYSGFGEITASNGTVTTGDGTLLRDANPFRYASYQYDNESGFYYLKSRYYIPFMGRFWTRDKVQSNNGYIYCNNNPVNMIDPDGYLGANWWNSVKAVGIALDAILIIISMGRTYLSWKLLTAFLRKYKNKILHQVRGKILKLFGYTVANALPGVLDLALTLAATSLGELIAKALDYADSWWGFKRNNGYIFN